MDNFSTKEAIFFISNKFNFSNSGELETLSSEQRKFLYLLPLKIERRDKNQEILTRITGISENPPFQTKLLVLDDILHYSEMDDISRNFQFYRPQEILKNGKRLEFVDYYIPDRTDRSIVDYRLVDNSWVRMHHIMKSYK